MNNMMANNEVPASEKQLKNVLEQSLAVLREEESADGQKVSQRPLGSSLPLYVHRANLRKGALVDAALALSKLWKVSKPTKVHNRVLEPRSAS